MYSFSNILHFLMIVMPLYYALQLLSYKQIRSVSTRILGILMILVSMYYVVTANFIVERLNIKQETSIILYLIFLSINPFYFLYTKSQTKEHFRFRLKCFVHFIPSLLITIYAVITLLLNNPDTDNQNGIFNSLSLKTIAVIIYNLQVLLYTIGMIILLRQHNINLKNYFSFKDQTINLNWLKIFTIIYIIFSGLDLTVYYTKSFNNWEYFYYPLIIVFFGFLGYYGVKQGDIYSKARNTEDLHNEDKSEAHDTEKKIILSEDRAQKLMLELIKYMEEKKPYKNHKLSIFAVADALKVNKTYISYVINANLQENFSSFTNRYRIKEAEELLTNPEYDNYTIEGIAKIVGFNSKSSFNSAFKKYTGTIPSHFKKNR